MDLQDQLQRTLGSTFSVERELGGGGMSRVFLAEELALARKVVIKVLPPEMSGGINADRFRREIGLAARLQHPHIVSVHSAGEFDGTPFYTMPYIDGSSLRDRLSSGDLPVAEAVSILHDVARALAYAHDHGVVHRDIKPDNILLSGGSAVVSDFGVAKAVSAATLGGGGLTARGVTVGTPAYMAPEQAAADPQLDHRADIYAFGCVAYEALTGDPPFSGTTAMKQMAAHQTETPVPLSTRRAAVPGSLAALVMRCLEKNPADRPQTAHELVAALNAQTTPTAITHWTGNRRRIWRVVAIASGLVAGLAAFAAWRTTQVVDAKRVAIAPLQNRAGSPEYAAIGPMAADVIFEGLSRTGVVDVSTIDVGDSARSAVSTAEGARDAARRGGAGTVIWGSYYRDGDSLRFEVRVNDVKSGRLLAAIPSTASPIVDPRRGLQRLRDRVMVALSTNFDSKLARLDLPGIDVPTYEAYQAYLLGLEESYRRRHAEAIRHFDRARAADSGFIRPLTWIASSYMNLELYPEADSVLRIARPFRDRMTSLDRAAWDWVDAVVRGSSVDELRAARDGFRIAPNSGIQQILLGFAESRAGNPRAAAKAFAIIDPSVMGGWPTYWSRWCVAFHLVEEEGEEARVARLSRNWAPQSRVGLMNEARLFARDGREKEVDSLITIANTGQWDRSLSATSLMREIALELRAHGHRAASDRVLERLLAALSEPSVGDSSSLALTLYQLGRYSEARPIMERRVLPDTGSPPYLIYSRNLTNHRILGTLAARMGDTATARRELAWLEALERPYLRGEQTFSRAQILAALGDREGSVALLREAIREGYSNYAALHLDFDLQLLAGYAPFEELRRPRG